VPGPSGRSGSKRARDEYTFENINFIRRIKSTTNNKENKKRRRKENTIMKRKEIIMADRRCQIMTILLMYCIR
jgi:hypothetical protein